MSEQALGHALDKILKDPLSLRYSFNTLIAKLKELKNPLKAKVIAKLKASQLMKGLFRAKLGKQSPLGVLRKIDYFALYEEIYGQKPKMRERLLKKAGKVFDQVSTDSADKKYYRRALLTSLQKHGYLDKVSQGHNNEAKNLLTDLTKDRDPEVRRIALLLLGSELKQQVHSGGGGRTIASVAMGGSPTMANSLSSSDNNRKATAPSTTGSPSSHAKPISVLLTSDRGATGSQAKTAVAPSNTKQYKDKRVANSKRSVPIRKAPTQVRTFRDESSYRNEDSYTGQHLIPDYSSRNTRNALSFWAMQKKHSDKFDFSDLRRKRREKLGFKMTEKRLFLINVAGREDHEDLGLVAGVLSGSSRKVGTKEKQSALHSAIEIANRRRTKNPNADNSDILALMEISLNDSDPEVRQKAVAYLSHFKHNKDKQKAFDLLTTFIKEEPLYSRNKKYQEIPVFETGLSTIGDLVTNEEERKLALNMMKQLSYINDRDTWAKFQRGHAMHHLVNLAKTPEEKKEVFAMMKRVIQNEPYNINRTQAIKNMEKLAQTSQEKQELLSVLDTVLTEDPSASIVRDRAILTMMRIGKGDKSLKEQAFNRIKKALEEDPDSYHIRRESIHALAVLVNPNLYLASDGTIRPKHGGTEAPDPKDQKQLFEIYKTVMEKDFQKAKGGFKYVGRGFSEYTNDVVDRIDTRRAIMRRIKSSPVLSLEQKIALLKLGKGDPSGEVRGRAQEAGAAITGDKAVPDLAATVVSSSETERSGAAQGIDEGLRHEVNPISRPTGIELVNKGTAYDQKNVTLLRPINAIEGEEAIQLYDDWWNRGHEASVIASATYQYYEGQNTINPEYFVKKGLAHSSAGIRLRAIDDPSPFRRGGSHMLSDAVALPMMKKVIDNSNEEDVVTYFAVSRVIEAQDQRALPILKEVLNNPQGTAVNKYLAITRVTEAKTEKAVPILKEVLNNPQETAVNKRIAINKVSELPHKQSLPILRRIINNPNTSDEIIHVTAYALIDRLKKKGPANPMIEWDESQLLSEIQKREGLHLRTTDLLTYFHDYKDVWEPKQDYLIQRINRETKQILKTIDDYE